MAEKKLVDKRALERVAKQVVINSGGRADYLEVLERLMKKYPDLKYSDRPLTAEDVESIINIYSGYMNVTPEYSKSFFADIIPESDESVSGDENNQVADKDENTDAATPANAVSNIENNAEPENYVETKSANKNEFGIDTKNDAEALKRERETAAQSEREAIAEELGLPKPQKNEPQNKSQAPAKSAVNENNQPDNSGGNRSAKTTSINTNSGYETAGKGDPTSGAMGGTSVSAASNPTNPSSGPNAKMVDEILGSEDTDKAFNRAQAIADAVNLSLGAKELSDISRVRRDFQNQEYSPLSLDKDFRFTPTDINYEGMRESTNRDIKSAIDAVIQDARERGEADASLPGIVANEIEGISKNNVKYDLLDAEQKARNAAGSDAIYNKQVSTGNQEKMLNAQNFLNWDTAKKNAVLSTLSAENQTLGEIGSGIGASLNSRTGYNQGKQLAKAQVLAALAKEGSIRTSEMMKYLEKEGK